MTLTEIVQAVVQATGRYDQEDYITRQVRSAIKQVHTSARFPRDLVEQLVPLNHPTTLIKLTLPPRFNKFKMLAPFSAEGFPIPLTTADNLYERKDPADLVTDSFRASVDHYYVAGGVVNIRSSVAPSSILMMYYALPEVADPHLETWAMASYDQLFIDAALIKVLGFFGNAQKVRELQMQYRMDLEQFVIDNLVEGED